ncbi:MAG TPA: type II toxin-antitoxin system prevent-host-death family antitoxin [Acidobacteriaceae bacterium]|nr:type II toxin-antitoxin system prevent-host-death family antitoxin [Acidobacteriaceae bacterium]
MIRATIFEAKTNFSDLLRKAQKGQTVIITTGRSRTPVARLQAIEPVMRKRLGALETPGFRLTAAFDEPLPEEELRLWNGESELPKPPRRPARKTAARKRTTAR